jgi:uncharacterized membrane protein YdbT with pleckstrin-like domain
MSSDGRAPEAVVARLRPHSRRLVLPTLVLVADCAALGYLYGSFDEEWQNWALLGAGAMIALVVFVFPVLAWLGTHYTITTRRIVLRHGIFVRVRQEMLHTRGYDVTVRAAGLQRIFGSGTVEINTGLDRPVVLTDVPNADLVQEALHEVMESSTNTVAVRRQQSQSAPSDETVHWGVR